ncbi:MAG: hypothetical protein IPI92_03230 [Gemmatimonadetes bacterium]|nr:hypothetical protein [Gemmatimonadota bacterium]MBK7783490.1 hypothetical protein [Gemmatimonadota bacterium]MBK9068462.1 hypothetical protein [Gemmatimonadota bacterium]
MTHRAWHLRAPVLAGALLLGPTVLAAQGTATAAGRVVREQGSDTIPVPAARVVLHRVGRDQQGPIDSLVTGADGRFRFRYLADTAAVFLLSSGYAGIEYFSTPLHLDPNAPDTGLALFVSDTSSVTPLEVVSHHVVISQPTADGTRPALEIVVLGNPGTVTRVAGDSAHPSWSTALPRGALGAAMGQGDVSPESVVFRGDSLLLYAPIAPGRKEVVFGYSLPAAPGPVTFTLPEGVASFTLLLEERGRTVTGGGLAAVDSQAIEGRTFQRWTGEPGPDSRIVIDFPGGGTRWLLPLLVGSVALALLAVLTRVLRRPVAPASSGPSPLLDQLARLDARYAGRQAEVPAAEWERYQSDRAALKAALESELAGRRART